ncbi:MAG: HD domain-containing protein [Burkholderiales bacterium]|nr:HD domain-containing protein [Burkholderiales bacterium]
MQERYYAALNPQAFYQAKMLEMRQRHVKYEDTPYSLEPNCKESPGGLRDLQVILWVAKAAGLGSSWRELAQRGLITLTEARQLMEKERAFKDIRVRLHIHCGRREDRLVFDVQTPIALSLGFQTTEEGKSVRRASEYLMQRYYWAAKVVTQLNAIMLQNEFRQDPANRALFLQIIQAPRGITHALRRMNQFSILGRYLPNFRRIVGQMQHDLFHVYTVDQHILMVVRNVRRFTMSEHAHEYPFCSQLMANFPNAWLIYIAALFHDIAKGRGGDHSKLGMEDARQFCVDHGLSEEDTELVVFLVEHHLTMSQVAQKQDLSDPDVIQSFARLVRDERHLTALYLLTVADIRGTSPKVWNAWKGKLLEDLYRITLRVLGGEAPSADRELKNRQDEALKTLRLYGLPNDAHVALWKQLDISYFLRHDASDIAWQTRALYDKLDSPTPIVKCRLAPIGEGLQITVYAQDERDVFARICSYFDRKNFSILDAKIHTTRHGYALDTFLVTEQTFANSYRDIISLIEHELTTLIKSEAPLSPPNKGRLSRLSRNFPITPTIDLRPDERGQYYLLSISANDRNGLLYSIANVMTKYKVNLHTAKVMTLGERVEDVFLIDGVVLNNSRNQIQFETELLEALRV